MSGEGLSAEEREALSASIDRDDLPGLYQPMIEAVERIVARRESEAAEKALRDAAAVAIGCEHSADLGWCDICDEWHEALRARADSVAQGREEGGK